MQVAAGCLDDDFLADQPAQRRADRRRLPVEHVGVADQREVGFQFVPVGVEEGFQRRRAAFLLALEQDAHPAGQLSVFGLPGATGLDEEHQLPLVVRGAPAGDDLAARLDLLDLWRKGVGFPEVDRVDRLHVIVAVEQHMRAVWRWPGMMRHDHRVSGRRAHAGVEADRLQVVDQPFRGLPAFGGIGGVGGNGLDAQQREQALQALVEIVVDTVENRGKHGHSGSGTPCGLHAVLQQARREGNRAVAQVRRRLSPRPPGSPAAPAR